MALSDAAGGVNNAIQQILARRMAEQQYADRMRQQQTENDLRERQFQSTEELKRAQLDATMENSRLSREMQLSGRATALGDQIPGGTFLPERDPAVGIMQAGGLGAMLTPQDERPAVPEGPLLPGDTGTAKMKGFLKTPSPKQMDTQADNERQASSAAGQAKRDDETARHNRAMESKPLGQSTVIVRDYDPETGQAVTRVEPRTPGSTYGSRLQPTTQERNTKAQYAKARPVLEGISALSEKINTSQGAIAKIRGAEAQAAAKINLNDDVAEYEAMVSGFTPLIARALGHTGVLTEQDVQSVKAMFPRPGDSKSLRDRKVSRIEQLMGAIEHSGGGSPAPAAKPSAADLMKKYGAQP